MRRVAAMVSAAAFLLVTASAVYAQKANFSGTWTVDAEKTAAANPAPAGGGGGGGGRAGGGGGGGRGGGQAGPMTVKQDATTLSVERQGQNGPTTTTYTLDGKPHKVTMGQGEADVTAKVDGATIVIDTTRDMGGNMVTTKAVWGMEGDYLVVANTQPGRNGGEATTRKTYYKKG